MAELSSIPQPVKARANSKEQGTNLITAAAVSVEALRRGAASHLAHVVMGIRSGLHFLSARFKASCDSVRG
jgi:hypothetical protein